MFAFLYFFTYAKMFINGQGTRNIKIFLLFAILVIILGRNASKDEQGECDISGNPRL